MVLALGIYLPLELTSPVLAGGVLSHIINRRSEKTGGEQGSRIRERGVILASGLMAGGALGGVFGAALRTFPGTSGKFLSIGGMLGAALRSLPKFSEDWIRTPFYSNDSVSQSISVLLFVCLCLYVWFYSVKKEKV